MTRDGEISLDGDQEEMWVEVIGRIDEVYSDLLRYETDLEQKNAALEDAYAALDRAHRDLQQAQRTLVEQEKMASIGRLVAGVAHELNNPISFVYGNIHALDRYRRSLEAYLAEVHAGGAPDDLARLRRDLKIDPLLADLGPLIEGTLEGAVRISDIVRNLRRLSFGNPGERRPIDLEAVIRTAAQWAQRAKNSRAALTIDASTRARAKGDEGQIHQVVVNLVDNALDAVAGVSRPAVAVSLTAEGDDVLITVADNGPGIAPAITDKIFEPFFTTKPVGQGTGLGLWISYAIAAEHGGSLAHVARPGGGACLVLRLPADRAAPRATDGA
ncbi:Signal transduction histidine kinase HoxJ (hydrogenase regulation) [Rhodovulum sp. PH10]|nr:Signal transduction histidine kinase HoxJ (hydrogenase regulation) [Rhodovulum sp. PH10]